MLYNTKERITIREMKRKGIYIVLTVLTSLLLYNPASAQRTMSGQPSLRVSSLYNGRFVGAEAFYEQYTLNGYWQTGIQGNIYKANLSSGHLLEYLHALVQGGYSFRIIGTRNRSLNLYVCVGAQAGVEVLDVWRSLPSYISLGKGRYTFIYGLYGVSILECFVSKHLALLLEAGVPITFGSAIGAVNWNVGLGFKWNL